MISLQVSMNKCVVKSPVSPPLSPISPVASRFADDGANIGEYPDTQSTEPHTVRGTLMGMGLTKPIQAVETLQGSIWRGSYASEFAVHKVVAKVTDCQLHANGCGLADGKRYRVQENICKEAGILKYLTHDPMCPSSIVKYRSFSRRNGHFYLLMDDGGECLFNFIERVHKLVAAGQVQVSELHKLVRVIFSQMLNCVRYMHSKNVVHFDISLENWLINDVEVLVHSRPGEADTMSFVLDDICVKLCDFGLSEIFPTKLTRSTKKCGKKSYKSPELLLERTFDAKQNDVWCLGVCLFMMAAGCHPWQQAKPSDKAFEFAAQCGVSALVQQYDLVDRFDFFSIYLVHNILQDEDNRLSLKEAQKVADSVC